MNPKALPITGEIKGAIEFQREVSRILEGLSFEEVEPKHPFFLPGTKLPTIHLNYYFWGSGMGDYICYMPAIIHAAKERSWIKGRVWCPEFFCEFAKNLIDQTGRDDWKVLPVERFEELVEDGSRTRGPGYAPEGRPNYQLLNGTGGHLVDIGFAYMGNTTPPPPGEDIYPVINFDNWDERHDLYHKQYVVFTTGATTPSRTVPGAYWNPIVEYVKSIGLTPVFLGVRKIIELPIKFPDGCDYAAGIDLRDKTTMMEAAWIMKNAKAVVGLDNGLIQLASCTDASIVCAYNMVAPFQREPKRVSGKWKTIFLSRDELACTGCQSFMKDISPPHNFRECLYGHLKCIDLLFGNQGEKFITALAELLE